MTYVRWFKFLQGLTVAKAKCILTYMCSDVQEKGPQALNKVRSWTPPHLQHLPRPSLLLPLLPTAQPPTFSWCAFTVNNLCFSSSATQ